MPRGKFALIAQQTERKEKNDFMFLWKICAL
jgi:hypothetical protein